MHSTTLLVFLYLLALNAFPSTLAAPGLIPSPVKREEPIHIPLKLRKRSGSQRDYGVIANSIRKKYGFPPVPSSSNTFKRSTSQTIHIADQEGDSSYIGTIEVGTP